MEKKDGVLQPCIDYRGLNAITIRYPYPLPLVPAALEQLRGTRFFTKLDLRSTYNLIRIKEGGKWKTAFHTTQGQYEYLVMPFSLTNAPAVFQALINGVFQDVLNKYVIAYIDDILVYSASFEEHVHHVWEVLSRLLKNCLFVKPEKCEYHRHTVTFLGYVISPRGVKMDQSKVQAVTGWPEPTTVKDLQRFLGFANFYCRFIRNYSSIASPLTSLLKGKPRKLAWGALSQEVFATLKRSFNIAPILRHPDPNRPFVLEVDASSCGVGTVLSQRHGTPSKLRPCAFNSRKLTPAEANYDVGNKELLSIKTLKIKTFSWQFEVVPPPPHPDPILPQSAILAPIRWNLVEEIQQAHAGEPPSAQCPPGKVYVPSWYRQQVMQWVHESISTGHPGCSLDVPAPALLVLVVHHEARQ
ncbi:hypothetical protein QTP86_007406 [Hemibagrus guttatus]|nr:hypothetical protein QTP86_007406 [Hemibagrus guttatus]